MLRSMLLASLLALIVLASIATLSTASQLSTSTDEDLHSNVVLKSTSKSKSTAISQAQALEHAYQRLMQKERTQYGWPVLPAVAPVASVYPVRYPYYAPWAPGAYPGYPWGVYTNSHASLTPSVQTPVPAGIIYGEHDIPTALSAPPFPLAPHPGWLPMVSPMWAEWAYRPYALDAAAAQLGIKDTEAALAKGAAKAEGKDKGDGKDKPQGK